MRQKGILRPSLTISEIDYSKSANSDDDFRTLEGRDRKLHSEKPAQLLIDTKPMQMADDIAKKLRKMEASVVKTKIAANANAESNPEGL